MIVISDSVLQKIKSPFYEIELSPRAAAAQQAGNRKSWEFVSTIQRHFVVKLCELRWRHLKNCPTGNYRKSLWNAINCINMRPENVWKLEVFIRENLNRYKKWGNFNSQFWIQFLCLLHFQQLESNVSCLTMTTSGCWRICWWKEFKK